MTIDPDRASAAKQLLKLKQAALSFPGFMDYYHPTMRWPTHLREYQEVLDKLEKDELLSSSGAPIRNLLVTMPPRHAKSFTGTVNFPAYCIMRRPVREVMIGCYNAGLAGTFGRGTRDIVTDKRAMKVFPSLELSKETRAVDFWKTTEGGAYYAVGMNGTTTGRGANMLCIDDPYKTREEAESITIRRKVWDYYISSFLTRLQPDKHGGPPAQIVTLTRWHPDDLAGRIMETPEFKAGEWLHLNFQALSAKERSVYIRRSGLPTDDPRYVPDEPMDPNNPDSGLVVKALSSTQRAVPEEPQTQEALWPERFPVEWLIKQRARIGEREFSALYQQQPYVLGGNLIKTKWLQRYKSTELPEMFALAISADTAFKAEARNDYSVFSLGGITETGEVYLMRVWRDKWEFPELKRKAIMLNAMWRGRGLRGMWVEDKASGQPLIQELKRDSGVTVFAWQPGSADKTTRASIVTPLIEGGRVFVPEDADWLPEWEDEVSMFPNAKNDDQVDSFVILLDVLSKMVVVGQQDWAKPLSEHSKSDPAFASSLVFTGRPLEADPNGWGSDRGILGGKEVDWKGWGA